MDVLVAGGTGFIGSRIVDALLANGEHRVKVMTREPARARPKLGVGFVRGDISNPALLDAAFLPAVLRRVLTAFEARRAALDARRTATFAVRFAFLTVRLTLRTPADGAATADSSPMAALTAGMTSLAISSIDARLSAGSVQFESVLRSNADARPAYAVASSGTRAIAPPRAVTEKVPSPGAVATS